MDLSRLFIETINADNIYIKNANHFVKLIVENSSFKKIELAKILQVSPSSVSKWLYSNVAIPITSFNFLYQLSKNKRIPDKIMFSTKSGSGIRTWVLPNELNSKLAYLLGYLAGDGCLHTNSYTISFVFNNLNECKRILSTLRKLFHIEADYDNYKTYFVVRLNSKVLHLFFNKLFDFPLGKKKGKLQVPSLIQNSSSKIKLQFIRGFFNADGCLCHTEKTYALMFKQSTERFLKQLKIMLLEFGYNLNGPYFDKQNDSWLLATWKASTINNLKRILEINAAIVQPGLRHEPSKFRRKLETRVQIPLAAHT